MRVYIYITEDAATVMFSCQPKFSTYLNILYTCIQIFGVKPNVRGANALLSPLNRADASDKKSLCYFYCCFCCGVCFYNTNNKTQFAHKLSCCLYIYPVQARKSKGKKTELPLTYSQSPRTYTNGGENDVCICFFI